MTKSLPAALAVMTAAKKKVRWWIVFVHYQSALVSFKRLSVYYNFSPFYTQKIGTMHTILKTWSPKLLNSYNYKTVLKIALFSTLCSPRNSSLTCVAPVQIQSEEDFNPVCPRGLRWLILVLGKKIPHHNFMVSWDICSANPLYHNVLSYIYVAIQ